MFSFAPRIQEARAFSLDDALRFSTFEQNEAVVIATIDLFKDEALKAYLRTLDADDARTLVEYLAGRLDGSTASKFRKSIEAALGCDNDEKLAALYAELDAAAAAFAKLI